MKKKASSALRVGVIGCGYWGPNLVRNFSTLPSCHVSLICDRDPGRLAHMKRMYPGAEVVPAIDYKTNGKHLDAVVIATPAHTHHPLARAALLAGCHVLVEKPMAASVQECDDLVDLAQKKKLVFMVGHTFLYSPPVRRIKDLILAGDIGTVRYISSRRLNLGLFQKDINVAWDLAPHDISIILYLTGSYPKDVTCMGQSNVTAGIEDVTIMTLRFPQNICAMLQSSWLDPRKVRDMTIVGDRRMVVYNDLEPLEKIRIYDQRVERPPHYDTYAEFHYSYHYGDIYSPYVKQEEPLKIQCQHFLDCIASGRRPDTDGEFGREVVRVLEASSRSLKQDGARIAIRPERRRGA